MYACLCAPHEDKTLKYNSAWWSILARLFFMMKDHCHFPGLEEFCAETSVLFFCDLFAFMVTLCIMLLFAKF